jgi:catechol 2,3-dioxygenase-like lactoylglutathione lyase family enzyme
MPCQIECIDHAEVFVRDLEAAARWYAEILGLEELRRWNPYPIMIGRGDTKLALFQLAEPFEEPTGKALPIKTGWRRIAWRTDEAGFAASQKFLKEKGITFTGPVDHDKAWSIYFCDPDGNPLEITYYL